MNLTYPQQPPEASLQIAEKPTVIDRFGRPLKIMRISVNHDCNFKCVFCHMEGEDPNSRDYLTAEEIGIVAEAASRLGVEKFKITGGEPTLRRDIVEIIEEIKLRAKPKDISMTTNGTMLEKLAHRLREAGLDRVNISLHSIDPDKFYMITQSNTLEKVLAGLEAAIDAGFRQIKINMVVMRGFNEEDIFRLIDLAQERRLTVQLIELHPVGEGRKVFRKYHTFLDSLEKELEKKAKKLKIRRDLHNRPIYYFESGGAVEIVRPVKNPVFCAACTRLRLTADGYLKPCLVRNDNLVGVKDILRRNIPREEKVKQTIKAILEANTRREPSAHWNLGIEKTNGTYRYILQAKLTDFRIQIPKKDAVAHYSIYRYYS